MEPVDLIIVGAGPGGSNAATAALRGGLHVLQIDGARFPRVKPCAGGITAKAAAALQQGFSPWGCRTFSAVEFNVWRHRTNRFNHPEPVLHTVCRPEFDNELVRRNLAHEHFRFMDGCRVLSVGYDDRFTVTTTKGRFTSRQLIGADGAYSIVNRTFRVTAPRALATAVELSLPGGEEGPPDPVFDFGAIEQGYGWVFTKRDHLSVGLYTLSPRTPHIRRQLLTYLRSKGLQLPGDRLSGLAGFRLPLGGFRLRVPACPVYVVGDAGGFADALTGEGIYAALESGRLAGDVAVAVACGAIGHRAYYRRLWRSVLCDTALTLFAARHFYKDIGRGFQALESPLVWRPLVEGAAAGVTLSECAAKSGSFLLRSILSGATVERDRSRSPHASVSSVGLEAACRSRAARNDSR